MILGTVAHRVYHDEAGNALFTVVYPFEEIAVFKVRNLLRLSPVIYLGVVVPKIVLRNYAGK